VVLWEKKVKESKRNLFMGAQHVNSLERKKQILEILEREESVNVVELTKRFSISKVTARNDLDDLEAKGLLVRTHGGAVLAEKRDLVRLVSNTINENREKKRRVCELAARFVRQGQNIIIDAGSTTVHLAKLLTDRTITVITNSVLIIDELMAVENIELVVAGGILRRPSMSCIGANARRCFEQLHTDMLFLGASGASLVEGVSCTNLIEADVKQAMIQSAQKVYLLVDSTKFGKVSLAKVCGWDAIDAVVTDSIQPETRAGLEALGVQVIAK
jgi:DeoR family fructose operon transcriptional repressor